MLRTEPSGCNLVSINVVHSPCSSIERIDQACTKLRRVFNSKSVKYILIECTGHMCAADFSLTHFKPNVTNSSTNSSKLDNTVDTSLDFLAGPTASTCSGVPDGISHGGVLREYEYTVYCFTPVTTSYMFAYATKHKIYSSFCR